MVNVIQGQGLSAHQKLCYHAKQYMCNIWSKFHHDIQPNNDFILFTQLGPLL